MKNSLADRLRRSGNWLGSSWLPRVRREGYAFAAHVEGGLLILSGIGGRVEPGESFLTAALREYVEETGTEAPELIPHDQPLQIDPVDGPPNPPEYNEAAEGAVLLIRKQPDGCIDQAHSLWIACFEGYVCRDPLPVEKVPAFLILSPQEFAHVAGSARRSSSQGRVIGRIALDWPAPVEFRNTAAAVAVRPRMLSDLWSTAP